MIKRHIACSFALCLILSLLVSCGGNGDGSSSPTRFRFPADDPDGSLFVPDIVFHVDHDDTPAEGLLSQILCKNFEGKGFPQCYGDHKGSDFMLRGGFKTMDSGSADVVAAADGEVIEVKDGNYDRCHWSLEELDDDGISCDGYPQEANLVKIRHKDGIVSHYLHLMKDSIVVSVGNKVKCGDFLGKVGSSGRSSAPHIHFEVHAADGSVIDPFAGEFSQPESLWVDQIGPYSLPGQKCR